MAIIKNRNGQTPSQFLTQLTKKIDEYYLMNPKVSTQEARIKIEILIHREFADNDWVIIPDASDASN